MNQTFKLQGSIANHFQKKTANLQKLDKDAYPKSHWYVDKNIKVFFLYPVSQADHVPQNCWWNRSLLNNTDLWNPHEWKMILL